MTIELHPGSTFASYTLERRLGGGGFGDVWLARTPDNEAVALKVLHGQYQTSEAAKVRAEIELLAAAASSRSEHIVRVLGGGSEPAPYVVMEYIDGVDLAHEIASRGALPVEEVLHIADGIADALATLQQAGIIHRDVKPANVMIDTQGVVKLTDFGIAKIVGIDTVTATSQMPMSMAYAAPEVWEGKPSHLSDHYAFGAMLYQCLAGRPPFTGSYAEIYRLHLTAAPNLSSLPGTTPPTLRSMIEACLAKDPNERPQTAQALQAALVAALGEFSSNSPTVEQRRFQEPRQLGPWIIQARSSQSEWTFLCRHESNGEQALVDVVFSDDLTSGEELRRKHPGRTSRLILRPGEGWRQTPSGDFQFWIASDQKARVTTAPQSIPEPLSMAQAPLPVPASLDAGPVVAVTTEDSYTPRVSTVSEPSFEPAAQDSVAPTKKRSLLLAAGALLAVVAAAAVGIALSSSGSTTQPSAMASEATEQVPIIIETQTSGIASPITVTTEVPSDQPVVIPELGAQTNRQNCNAIRGTPYRSEEERLWFAANCSGQPQLSSTPTPSSSLFTPTPVPSMPASPVSPPPTTISSSPSIIVPGTPRVGTTIRVRIAFEAKEGQVVTVTTSTSGSPSANTRTASVALDPLTVSGPGQNPQTRNGRFIAGQTGLWTVDVGIYCGSIGSFTLAAASSSPPSFRHGWSLTCEGRI